MQTLVTSRGEAAGCTQISGILFFATWLPLSVFFSPFGHNLNFNNKDYCLTFSHLRRQTCAALGHPAQRLPGGNVPPPGPPGEKPCTPAPRPTGDCSSPEYACPQSLFLGRRMPSFPRGWCPWCQPRSCEQAKCHKPWSSPGTIPCHTPGRRIRESDEGTWQNMQTFLTQKKVILQMKQ